MQGIVFRIYSPQLRGQIDVVTLLWLPPNSQSQSSLYGWWANLPCLRSDLGWVAFIHVNSEFKKIKNQ